MNGGKKRGGAKFSVAGALLFFVTVALMTTVVMLVYGLVDEKCDGDRPTVALVMFLVILFFSVLCTALDLLRRRLMIDRPVEKILAATERIAKGDFSVRLEPAHPYGKYDEYDRIMENINLLAEELGKSEILKTDFVSNVSHELKTPLAVIRNYADCLAREDLSEADRRTHAATLSAAAKRLTDLVTNILKLNKLENSKTRPEKEWIRLDEQLAEATLRLESQIEEKELRLEIDMDEISAFTSPSLLELVWNNLLSNAVKFTDKGGTIGVSLKRKEGNALVRIRDTGCGISPETGKRIFDKFYQGDTSHASEGNGLGLALVKKVIDILGGEISVESRPQQGSTFTVLLRERIL